MKYIFITGVSSGIGYAATEYFLEKGYHVFGTVRKESDKQRLEKEFTENFTSLVFDVTDKKAIDASILIVRDVLGEDSLTALVNNAGHAIGGPISLLDDEVFKDQIEVNLFGVRNVTNALLPFLGASKEFKGKAGKIINISSISGILNTPMNGAYCIAKHALESLSEVYRRELMMYGIKVVTIQPGPIASRLWKKNIGSLKAYYDGDYSNMAYNVDKIMIGAKKDALPAKVIAERIERIIESRFHRSSYIVTRQRLFNTIFAKYIPKIIVDHLLFYRLNKQP